MTTMTVVMALRSDDYDDDDETGQPMTMMLYDACGDGDVDDDDDYDDINDDEDNYGDDDFESMTFNRRVVGSTPALAAT